MNNMKKFASLLLALVMVLAMAVPAMAAMEGTLTGGSITINDAVDGNIYNAYQILYLESYSTTTNTYAYKANSAWAAWLKTQTTYVSIDEQGYVTWVANASAADFAAAAKSYAETQNFTADKTATASGTTVVLSELNLGYYLVDTTLGTICSLDTTNPNVVMEEKNEKPTVTKEVKEDSTGNFGETNDADIGQSVEFKATITVQAGAVNYTLHDEMSEGLTFGSVTSVMIGEIAVDAKNYTVTSTGLTDGCDFEVKFDNDYIKTLTAGTQIVVSYNATVNANAKIGVEGNPNTVKLTYGEKATPDSTPEDKTITYTWDTEVLKYANGNESNVLAGVKFVLLNSTKDKVAIVVDGKLTGWTGVPAANANGVITWPTNTTLTTDANGKISIDGLDADTYYLREIETLPGYNKLADDKVVKVEAGKADSEDADKDNNTTELAYTTGVTKVENKSGSTLPETGGMGTTVIYVAGGLLVAAAVILMVSKRRRAA